MSTVLKPSPSIRKPWRHPLVTRQCKCGKTVRARHARYCDDCRCLVRRKKKKYEWTPAQDAILRERYDGKKGTAAAIAATLHWPKWVVTKRAQALGLSRPAENRTPWSDKEAEYLVEWAGRRSVTWIARRLKRTDTSVVLKMKRLHISQKIQEGYTMRELELCFGVDHHSIDRWIRDGKLKARRKERGCSNAFGFTDNDVIAFIRSNPTAFRLDRVDQFWFLDLVIGGGLLRERAE